LDFILQHLDAWKLNKPDALELVNEARKDVKWRTIPIVPIVEIIGGEEEDDDNTDSDPEIIQPHPREIDSDSKSEDEVDIGDEDKPFNIEDEDEPFNIEEWRIDITPHYSDVKNHSVLDQA
jgi:hypothetical protein